jgi:hypothetical protein
MRHAPFAFAAALALLTLLTLQAPARADYHIFSPYEIDYGELEIEHNGDAVFDRRPSQENAKSYTLELGTGPTPWWHTEIEFSFDRAPGPSQPTLMTGVVTENMFQLAEPGEYFADPGFYIEYGQSLTRGAAAAANELTFGPVIGKDIGRTTHIINLFLTRQLGPDQTDHGYDFSYAWQSRWNIWAPLSPAVEIYGDMGSLGHAPGFQKQQLLIGPVGVGRILLNQIGLGRAGQIKYEAGWLFGATEASARGTLRWRLEVEIPF